MYLIDFSGRRKPCELTSGKQGATHKRHNPVLDAQGDKVAWAELDGDGYESDRFVAKSSLSADSESNSPVQGQDRRTRLIDLKKDVRYSLTQPWDLSIEELAVRSCFFLTSRRSANLLAVLSGLYFSLSDCW